MARINIEASASLSDWIDLMRADQQHFRKLVKAAVQLLPFPITQLDGSTYYNRFRAFSAFNSAYGGRYLLEAFARDFGSQWLEQVLPYAIAFKPPTDWSLDEQSREIALPGAEPR